MNLVLDMGFLGRAQNVPFYEYDRTLVQYFLANSLCIGYIHTQSNFVQKVSSTNALVGKLINSLTL